MSTPKHDPAPWRLCRDQSGWYISPIEALLPFGSIEDLEASFRPDGGEPVIDPTGRYAANARLVVMSPDLFDVCQRLIDSAKSGEPLSRIINDARAAIALIDRATGGAL